MATEDRDSIDRMLSRFQVNLSATQRIFAEFQNRMSSFQEASIQHCSQSISEDLELEAGQLAIAAENIYEPMWDLRAVMLEAQARRFRIVHTVQMYVNDYELRCRDLGYCENSMFSEIANSALMAETFSSPIAIATNEENIVARIRSQCSNSRCKSIPGAQAVAYGLDAMMVEAIGSLTFPQIAFLALRVVKARDQDIVGMLQSFRTLPISEYADRYRSNSFWAASFRGLAFYRACSAYRSIKSIVFNRLPELETEARASIEADLEQMGVVLTEFGRDQERVRHAVIEFDRNWRTRTSNDLARFPLRYQYSQFLIRIFEMSNQSGFSVFDEPGGSSDPLDWQLPSLPPDPGILRRDFRGFD